MTRKHGKHEIDDKAINSAVADSPVLRAELIKQAAIVARRANASLTRRQNYPDYDVAEYTYKSGIPGTTVFTRSNHAKHSNAKHNTLLRVLGGALGGQTQSGQHRRKPSGKPHGKHRRT